MARVIIRGMAIVTDRIHVVNISPAGLHLIAGFEGFRPDWYDDGTGTRTIGFGQSSVFHAVSGTPNVFNSSNMIAAGIFAGNYVKSPAVDNHVSVYTS